jgi:hypothetical protein
VTRFAGDGRVLELRGQKTGRVVSMEARRIQSRAEKVRTDALESWLLESSAGSFSESDYRQLWGYLPFLSRAAVEDFAVEATGFLLLAHHCPDGDPAQAVNLERFRSCVADVLRADAEAAGR